MFMQRNLPGEEAEGNAPGKGFRAEDKGENCGGAFTVGRVKSLFLSFGAYSLMDPQVIDNQRSV